MRNGSDRAKLEEVKTILQQLQRIRPDLARQETQDDTDPAIAGPIDQEPALPPPHRSETAHAETERPMPRGAMQRPAPTKTIALVSGVAFGIALLAAGGMVLYQRSGHHHSPSAGTAVNPGATTPFGSALDHDPIGSPDPATERQAGATAVLSQAQRLMVSGDILLARETLLKSVEGGSSDIALALARSYDPNVLSSVANPNAAPDVEVAELWYRRWHASAVEEGLMRDTKPLERIIRSMH